MKLCPKCQKEKKTYMFDKDDGGLCVLCSKRDLFAKPKKGGKRRVNKRPRPGDFYRDTGPKKTRKRVLDIIMTGTDMMVKYLTLDGPYENKERTITWEGFRVNHVRETEEMRDFKGWEKKEKKSGRPGDSVQHEERSPDQENNGD